MYRERYVYDALYGRVGYPDYVWNILSCPELQRLREVRLCNINSLCLPGGANISRYEHSLGAAFLALTFLQSQPLTADETTQRRIVLAALLHDIGSAAFGHSIEYVLGPSGYKPEASLYDLVRSFPRKEGGGFEYQHALTEPIYFGMPRRLGELLEDEDLQAVSDMVAGKGPYGPLIAGTMDLDNIDNVYRMSYHVGLTHSAENAIQLAGAIRIGNAGLVIDDDAAHLVEHWYDQRRRLYLYLLRNPDEFSAKCMLQEALELARTQSSPGFSWYYVDYQLLEKLASISDETRSIVSRLMVGELYGCVGLYSTSRIEARALLSDPKSREDLEELLEERVRHARCRGFTRASLALHMIEDVNKTQRRVELTTTAGRKLEIGIPSRQLLLGVFVRNAGMSISDLDEGSVVASGIRSVLKAALVELTRDSNLRELALYGEAAEAD